MTEECHMAREEEKALVSKVRLPGHSNDVELMGDLPRERASEASVNSANRQQESIDLLTFPNTYQCHTSPIVDARIKIDFEKTVGEHDLPR